MIPGEVRGKQIWFFSKQNILDIAFDNCFVHISFADILNRGRSVNHRMITWCLFHPILYIIPVFDDQTILKPENIKADFGAKKIIFGMKGNIVSVG
ncbi:hypothetical protein D3C73_1330700 [compost metagenome]